MKVLPGLLILAASLQPYIVWANSETAAATAAVAAAYGGGVHHGAPAGSAVGAASGGRGGGTATATAAAAGSAAGGTATATAVATATATYQSSAYIPCTCEREYKPVCGCDGKTYSNKCVLECISAHKVGHKSQALHVKRHGECINIPCRCAPFGKSICGSDGQIYANECYFKCENTRCAINGLYHIMTDPHGGSCKQQTCTCPNNINPVCGTDGRTYRALTYE